MATKKTHKRLQIKELPAPDNGDKGVKGGFIIQVQQPRTEDTRPTEEVAFSYAKISF